MSRPLLVPFPALALVMGLAYVLGHPERTSGPAFDLAKLIAHYVIPSGAAMSPMQLWGWVFLVGAVALSAAACAGQDQLIISALIIGGGIYLWWAVVLGAAGLTAGSANAWAVYLFVSLMHFGAAYFFAHREASCSGS